MNPRLAVWVVNGLLAGLAAVSLFPLLWMLSVSLMPAGASTTLPTPVLPPAVTLDNYRTLFGGVGLGRYVFNSLAIAVLATLLSVSFNVMAGYAFAKLRFAGREAIFKTLLGALVIPGQVAMLPLFLMLKPLGLINTYGGAIVPAMASVATTGRSTGTMMVVKMRSSLAPSMRAASIRSSGMPRANWRTRKMPNTLAIVGTTAPP